ncbi:hypothetical protein MASR2M16_08210 [Thauera terpenica]
MPLALSSAFCSAGAGGGSASAGINFAARAGAAGLAVHATLSAIAAVMRLSVLI